MRHLSSVIGFAALAVLALRPVPVRAQSASLDFVTKPTLIECEPQVGEPCFRLKFGFIDEGGKPIKLQLPPANQLTSHVEVQVDGEAVKPFYVAATAGKSEQVRLPQITLLLFDISGSMLTTDLAGQSRFEAAKGAAAEFLKSLSDRQDLVAVVPFASRNVENTIAAAHFVDTKAEAQAQLEALPRPEPRNNTALYSAVRAAIETLRNQRRAEGTEVRLILLTDGTNDVQPAKGDDAGLLTGQDGLAAAAGAVQASEFDVLPIGIGDRRSIDEAAMARLGTRPPLITFDVNALHKAFMLDQAPRDGSITVTLQAPESVGSRSLLAGRMVRFRARMTLADGSALVENRQAFWVAPPVATPVFEDEATDAEQRAFLHNAHLDRDTLWVSLHPFIVFAGFAALLTIMWFVVPRLIWPERYDSRAARPLRPEYWPGAEPISRRDNYPVLRNVPPGFETAGRGSRAVMRTPAERTIVQAATGFDPNKTRLS